MIELRKKKPTYLLTINANLHIQFNLLSKKLVIFFFCNFKKWIKWRDIYRIWREKLRKKSINHSSFANLLLCIQFLFMFTFHTSNVHVLTFCLMFTHLMYHYFNFFLGWSEKTVTNKCHSSVLNSLSPLCNPSFWPSNIQVRKIFAV